VGSGIGMELGEDDTMENSSLLHGTSEMAQVNIVTWQYREAHPRRMQAAQAAHVAGVTDVRRTSRRAADRPPNKQAPESTRNSKQTARVWLTVLF
jgi:hypothetical protein